MGVAVGRARVRARAARARDLALANARAEAEGVAAALGISVGRVLSVSMAGPPPDFGRRRQTLELQAAGAPAEIRIGTIEVSATANVAFEIVHTTR